MTIDELTVKITVADMVKRLQSWGPRRKIFGENGNETRKAFKAWQGS